MNIFLDSADLGEIREALRLFPIDGVTTNPTILARTGCKNPSVRLGEIKESIGDRTLFVQVTEGSAVGMISEARRICEAFGRDTVIKVPVNVGSLEAMKAMAVEGIRVCATAVYTVPQAVLAAKAGAEFVAPYVSHIDAMAFDGPAEAVRMQEALEMSGYGTKVLGASFRVVSQVEKLMAGGVGAATVTLDMLRALASSAGSDRELASFCENWQKAYGDKHLCDFM